MKMNYLNRILLLAGAACAAFTGLSASSGFECDYCALANQPLNCESETEGFTVVRLGASGLSSVNVNSPAHPFVGLARRYEKGATAVEVSASWSENDERYGKTRYHSRYYSVPKILCLQYAQPRASSSFFYGAGLSWGGIRSSFHDSGVTSQESKFRGILGDVALGYEIQRDSTVRAIAQLDIAQPLIASRKVGDLPPANIVMTLGIGF